MYDPMKNGCTLLLCSLCLLTSATAQQLSLFTQYREQIELLNPAAIASDYFLFENNVAVGITHRRQWNDLPATPETQTLRYSYFNADNRGVAAKFGGHLINDNTGPTGFTGLYGNVGGVFSSDPYFGGISVALNLGLVQYRLRTDELRLRDPGDIEAMGDQTRWYPDVGLGVFYYQMIEGGWFDDDYVYGCISVPQLIGLDLTFTDPNGDFFIERLQHYYAQLGLYKFLRDDHVLEPSIWLRYVPNAPVSVDFNLRYLLAGNFWVGSGISTGGNFHVESGFVLGSNSISNTRFRIGYGFDYSFSDFGPSVGGVHEINLSIGLDR